MSEFSLGDLDKQFVATTEQYELYIGENNKNEEIVFTVGRTGSVLHEKISRKYQRQLERSRRNKDKLRKVLINIVAESVLLDWKGLIDDDGKKVTCNLENKVKVLTTYKEIFDLVVEAAGDTANFRIDEEETVKN